MPCPPPTPGAGSSPRARAERESQKPSVAVGLRFFFLLFSCFFFRAFLRLVFFEGPRRVPHSPTVPSLSGQPCHRRGAGLPDCVRHRGGDRRAARLPPERDGPHGLVWGARPGARVCMPIYIDASGSLLGGLQYLGGGVLFVFVLFDFGKIRLLFCDSPWQFSKCWDIFFLKNVTFRPYF